MYDLMKIETRLHEGSGLFVSSNFRSLAFLGQCAYYAYTYNFMIGMIGYYA